MPAPAIDAIPPASSCCGPNAILAGAMAERVWPEVLPPQTAATTIDIIDQG
jgi:hypothetical protein